MKKSIAGYAAALSVALATVGTTAAFALAADGADGHGTRHSYVVGGELVQPPEAGLTTSPRPASISSRAGSTRHGYVVGGELIVPER